MTLLDAKIQSIVQKDCRLNPDERVLVGVSGGPDSVCLLHSLQKLGIPVIAAYFNHQLRPGSADEESFVRDFAASHQAAYVTGGEDIGALAGKTGTSLEAAGEGRPLPVPVRAGRGIQGPGCGCRSYSR